MNRRLKKILATCSAFLMLASVAAGLNVFAWTSGTESYDYGFNVVKGDSDGKFIQSLDSHFAVYKFSEINKTGGTTAAYGPANPSAANPDDTQYGGTLWTAKSWGTYARGWLKPTTNPSGGDKSYWTLTYKTKSLVNFKAEYTASSTYNRFGVAFGAPQGTFPISLDKDNTNDTGVMIFCEKEGHLNIGGAIDLSTVTVATGLTAPDQPSGATLSDTAFFRIKNFTADIDPTDADNADYTLCIKVDKGVLTVYEKSAPAKTVSVKLTNKYTGGYLSLLGNQSQHGSFKAFGISAIEYANCDALDAQKTRLNALTLSNYTDSSVAAVNALLAQEEAMRAKPKTEQTAVDSYVASLKSAIDALVPKAGDYTALQAALDSIPTVLDNYTEDSVAALNTAKAAAEAALSLDILHQNDINAAAETLTTAVNGLRLKSADLSALRAALAAIPADLSGYTDDSVAALNAAKTRAEAMIASQPDITKKTEIDALTEEVNAAVRGLTQKPTPTVPDTQPDGDSKPDTDTEPSDPTTNPTDTDTTPTDADKTPADNGSTAPATGDSLPQLLWLGFALLSCLGMAAALLKKRSRA